MSTTSDPDRPDATDADTRSACVFAPSPLLTVTVEDAAGGGSEVHLHAGGQGFWIDRMLVALGLDTELCVPLGGEAPRMQRVDHRGAGDTMTAGIAAALGHGRQTSEALRLGAAAGASNVTRRGPGHRPAPGGRAARGAHPRTPSGPDEELSRCGHW